MYDEEKPSVFGVMKGAQLLLERARQFDVNAEYLSSIEKSQKAEQIYWAAGEAMLQVKDFLKGISEAPLDALRVSEDIPVDTVEIEAGFEDIATDFSSFHCRFPSPPVLKTKAATSKFFELFCLDLQRVIVRNLPDRFKKMESVVVVFVNRYVHSSPHKQPYFDNDNLAIKAILDSVVPYICYDDASRFCDNLYLSQPGQNDYSELFIIRKSSFPFWVSKHLELDFCSNLALFVWLENSK